MAELNGHIVTHLVNAERYLHLPQAALDVKVLGDKIEIATDVFARQVTLAFPDVTGGVFEDNFFDMIPAQKRRIRIHHNPGADAVTVRSVNANTMTIALDKQ